MRFVNSRTFLCGKEYIKSSLMLKEDLSVLMLCAPSNRRRIRKWRTSSIFVFCPFSREKKYGINLESALNMASSDSQIDKPQRGRPKRAEMPDVNINTGAPSIDTERDSLRAVTSIPAVTVTLPDV